MSIFKKHAWPLWLGTLAFVLTNSIMPAHAAKIKTCADLSIKTINKKAKHYEPYITKHTRKHGIDRDLVKAIIGVESCYRRKARSRMGAYGLMQLMPKTAKRFGVSDRSNASQNIEGGVKYLKFLKKKFKNNKRKMAAAYNAGEGNVSRYGGIPPFKETRRYVKRVFKLYGKLKRHRNQKRISNLITGNNTDYMFAP